jgi:hypothetical protein
MVQNQYQLAENDPPPVLFHEDETYSCRSASARAVLRIYFCKIDERESSDGSASMQFQQRREIKGLENINYLM